MLTNFIREAADHTVQPAITVPEPAMESGDGIVRIKRKYRPEPESTPGIYDRARVIYYRARRQGMTRAAGIF
jgi:hypothetical protein